MKLLQRLFSRGAGSDGTGNPDGQAWLQQAVHQAGREIAADMGQQLRQAQRSMGGSAETPAWTASWSTTSSDINDLLSRQLPTMRARSEGLARSDEWATRYLIQLEDNVLGEDGIRLQMRVKRGETFDKETNNALEAFWRRWGKPGACEASGKLSWREVEAVLLGCEERCGEILYRLRPGRGPFGFQIQILNPKLLDITLKRDWQGRRVRMGVEIDDDGAPIAYWLRMHKAGDGGDNSDITTVGRHVRVPADQIRHRFLASEVDQLRGVPGLSVGARRLWLLNDFQEAAAVATSNAAKRQGFFVSPDGNAPPGMADTIISTVLQQAVAQGKTLTAEEINTLKAAAQQYATTMPGQFDTLPVGYDFKPFESKWPDINSSSYIKDQLRGWSAARGVSYHTLGNDLESVNYSSAQVGIGDERQHFKVRQRRLIGWLHSEVIEHVIKRAPLFDTSLKASRLAEYLAAVHWQPRTWAPIDPLKAAEANDIALRNRSTTRRRIWDAQGLDADDMQREVLEDEATFGRLEGGSDAGSAARSQRHEADEQAELAGIDSIRSHRAIAPASTTLRRITSV
jgi:lambda family phage portal protein